MSKKKIDYPLLIILAILLVLGILILSSVSASLSQERFGYPYYYLRHQFFYGILPGLILAFIFFKIPLAFFQKIALPFFLINLAILGLVFLPKIGIEKGGASRWIAFGPISFQPAEFLKITFLIYLATWLSSKLKKSEQKRFKKSNLPLVFFLSLLVILSTFLVFQPNIGTLSLIFLTASMVYFGAGTPLWQNIFIILIGVSGILTLIKIAPYRLSRLLVYLNPEIDPMGMGYQIKQALIAVGSGGILGLGLGLSRQKFGFLPQPMEDSVFAIFAEEGGFIGAIILISLFLAFFWQGLIISKKSFDKFSQLLSLGITSWILLQAFINIGAILGILPLTGIPLPFISYGGSHLIAELIGVGILLNISKNIKLNH